MNIKFIPTHIETGGRYDEDKEMAEEYGYNKINYKEIILPSKNEYVLVI